MVQWHELCFSIGPQVHQLSFTHLLDYRIRDTFYIPMSAVTIAIPFEIRMKSYAYCSRCTIFLQLTTPANGIKLD